MTPGAAKEPLFTPDEIRRIERLHIRRRRAVHGGIQGEWRSARYGSSGLFADHRGYVAGDDLRYVDWNVFGRLGDLVVKRFEAEENVNLLLCVDRSLSMSGRKTRAARRLAGALGVLALTHLDHVRLAWLPAPSAVPITSYRSRRRTGPFMARLASTPDAGTTDHVRDLGRVLAATRHRGLALLVSDFFDPEGAIRGLALLRARGLEVGAIHVVDPSDVDLPQGGSIVAIDAETGEAMEIDVTPALRTSLHRAWEGRIHGLERWCLAREIPYHRVDARRTLWETLRAMLAARVAVGA